MIYHKVVQRSDEWHRLRCGHLTGSAAEAAISKGRGGAESEKRIALFYRLLGERLTNEPEAGSTYVSDDMRRGIEKEPDAIARYEAVEGALVDVSVGFVSAEWIWAGYSPDGLVGDSGVLECKCPKTSTHLGYLRDPSSLAKRYMPQILHGLWVTGREWCDITSFDDRLPEKLRSVTYRVGREGVGDYAAKAEAFLAEVELELASFKGWDILRETA